MDYVCVFLSALAGVFSNYYAAYRKAHKSDFSFYGYLVGALDYTVVSVGSLALTLSSAIASGSVDPGTAAGCVQVFVLSHFVDSWVNKPPKAQDA